MDLSDEDLDDESESDDADHFFKKLIKEYKQKFAVIGNVTNEVVTDFVQQ